MVKAPPASPKHAGTKRRASRTSGRPKSETFGEDLLGELEAVQKQCREVQSQLRAVEKESSQRETKLAVLEKEKALFQSRLKALEKEQSRLKAALEKEMLRLASKTEALEKKFHWQWIAVAVAAFVGAVMLHAVGPAMYGSAMYGSTAGRGSSIVHGAAQSGPATQRKRLPVPGTVPVHLSFRPGKSAPYVLPRGQTPESVQQYLEAGSARCNLVFSLELGHPQTLVVVSQEVRFDELIIPRGELAQLSVDSILVLSLRPQNAEGDCSQPTATMTYLEEVRPDVAVHWVCLWDTWLTSASARAAKQRFLDALCKQPKDASGSDFADQQLPYLLAAEDTLGESELQPLALPLMPPAVEADDQAEGDVLRNAEGLGAENQAQDQDFVPVIAAQLGA